MSIKLFILNKKNKNNGFVILYAVVIATVVLLVGVSLMNIMTKQLFLSSISRNAKVSYYAALAGRDCAEFWKKIKINEADYFSLDHTDDPLKCFGNDPVESYKMSVDPYTSAFITTFNLEFTAGTNILCSKVMVEYNQTADCVANRLLISSEGYNDNCSATKASNVRLVRSVYKDKRATCN